MRKDQKLIVASLATVAVLIFLSLGCVTAFVFLRAPSFEAEAAPEAVANQPPSPPEATATPQPTAPPFATDTPTPTVPSTATGTPVVTETVLPSPTPTRANCIDNIVNFEASGVVTSQQVQQYVRETVPPLHLENCREIRYIPLAGGVHGRAVSGSFIPIVREIKVYALDGEAKTVSNFLDTVVHEIGHNVHYNLRRYQFDLDVEWSELYKQSQQTFKADGSGFVSDYARTNKFEDFAETYLAYVRYPEFLKLYNPNKYEYMRLNVFEGQEY